MIVNLKNPNTNQFKQVKIGFSWTMFSLASGYHFFVGTGSG